MPCTIFISPPSYTFSAPRYILMTMNVNTLSHGNLQPSGKTLMCNSEASCKNRDLKMDCRTLCCSCASLRRVLFRVECIRSRCSVDCKVNVSSFSLATHRSHLTRASRRLLLPCSDIIEEEKKSCCKGMTRAKSCSDHTQIPSTTHAEPSDRVLLGTRLP